MLWGHSKLLSVMVETSITSSNVLWVSMTGLIPVPGYIEPGRERSRSQPYGQVQRAVKSSGNRISMVDIDGIDEPLGAEKQTI